MYLADPVVSQRIQPLLHVDPIIIVTMADLARVVGQHPAWPQGTRAQRPPPTQRPSWRIDGVTAKDAEVASWEVGGTSMWRRKRAAAFSPESSTQFLSGGDGPGGRRIHTTGTARGTKRRGRRHPAWCRPEAGKARGSKRRGPRGVDLRRFVEGASRCS